MAEPITDIASIHMRLTSIERSVRRWKLLSLMLIACMACAAFMAADNSPKHVKYEWIDATTVSAKNFILSDGQNRFGAFYLEEQEGGKYVPTIDIQAEKNAFYVALKPDMAVMEFEFNGQNNFAFHASNKSTILDISNDTGVGIGIIAPKGGGGAVMKQTNGKMVPIQR